MGNFAKSKKKEAKSRKKELISIYFVNSQKTEKLNIKVLRTVKAKEYFIRVVRYPTDGIRYGTLFSKTYVVSGNVLEELARVIKEHAANMTLEFYWIESNLQHRAKIFLTPVDLFEENLEKLAEYL